MRESDPWDFVQMELVKSEQVDHSVSELLHIFRDHHLDGVSERLLQMAVLPPTRGV